MLTIAKGAEILPRPTTFVLAMLLFRGRTRTNGMGACSSTTTAKQSAEISCSVLGCSICRLISYSPPWENCAPHQRRVSRSIPTFHRTRNGVWTVRSFRRHPKSTDCFERTTCILQRKIPAAFVKQRSRSHDPIERRHMVSRRFITVPSHRGTK